MQRALVFIALTSFLGAPLARADFVLAGPSPPKAADMSTGQPPTRTNRLPVRIHTLASAQGFGQRVPLSFAVRQIVPPSVRVSYGPDVDSGAVVDWTGGAPWDQVLRAAVEPLGLRLVVGRGTVEVRR